jgi:hypothetical protein
MAVQIIDDGTELKIVTNGVPRSVTKSNVKTVELLANSTIKIDIGKDPLHNIYLNQSNVDNPTSTSPADLRDRIAAMLQAAAGSGDAATATNQLAQTAQLLNIRGSINAMSDTLTAISDVIIWEPKLVDETEGRVIYKGFALPGTAETAGGWAIQRVTNDDGNISYHWALGTKNFDKQWALRREYQYS